MSKNEVKAIMISRLLTPEHRDDLLAWVRLAYTAENSVRKLSGSDLEIEGKSQEYS